MAAEIRLNADNAQLTLDEMADFAKQAKKWGVPGHQPIGVRVNEGVVVFSVPTTLVHRTLAGKPAPAGATPMRGAKRQRR